jgi:hypothetical protein
MMYLNGLTFGGNKQVSIDINDTIYYTKLLDILVLNSE